LAFDAWLSVGRRTSEICNASAWWLGDWLLYGQRAYGRRYKRALESTPLDYQTLRNYAWVSRRFEPSRRRDKLSFQHHAEVAALPEADQDLWLQRAQRLRWSRNELRRQLAAARRSTRTVGDAPAMVLRVQVTREREQRWRTAAAANEQTLVEWLASTVDAAADAVLDTEASVHGAVGLRPVELSRSHPARPASAAVAARQG
jgi:hypothetical protein